MRNSTDYPIAENAERRAEQSALPSMVRRAISIAMLTGVSAGCMQQQPAETISQNPVPVAAVPSSSANLKDSGSEMSHENLNENSIFTPQRALREALSEPLTFTARIKKEGDDNWTHMCFWKNEKIRLRSFHHKPKEKESEAIFSTYSPQGESLEFAAEAKKDSIHSIYDIKRNEYDHISLVYKDYSVDPHFNFTMPPEQFASMDESWSMAFFSSKPKWPLCLTGLGSWTEGCYCGTNGRPPQVDSRFATWLACGSDTKYGNLEKAMNEFKSQPSQEWYDLLQDLRKLYTRHHCQ